MKYEWKKTEKNIYGVKQIPKIEDIPAQNFIMIKGSGNPNMEDFSNRVSVLYSLAYSIKMLFKKTIKDEDSEKITDFTVYPLEGIWEEWEGEKADKSKLRYTIMIKQPDFITRDIFEKAIEEVKKKKPNNLYDEIVFEILKEGRVIQVLHIGSYDDEPESFEKIEKLASKMGLSRIGNSHKEIYLSNKNRTAKDKQKTVLRYSVR